MTRQLTALRANGNPKAPQNWLSLSGAELRGLGLTARTGVNLA